MSFDVGGGGASCRGKKRVLGVRLQERGLRRKIGFKAAPEVVSQASF